MAYVYSASQTNSSYGNVKMSISLLRGDCTRTETSVSFKFGVRFIVTEWNSTAYGTWNSVAAWYKGEQRFANANCTNGDGKSVAQATIPYYAYYTDYKTPRNYKSEYLCYSYSNSNITANTTSVDIEIGAGWADWAGTQKGTLKFSMSIPKYIGNGSTPTVTVTDKGNNTCTISGTLGKKGTNNNIESAKLYYTTDGSDPKSSSSKTTVSLSASSGATYSKNIAITKACTVKAYVVCTFEHNTTTATDSSAIKYYVKPSTPGTPYLVDNSFKNGRLTVKQDWGWEWPLANPGNTSSYNAVKGYRVRFFVKRKSASNFVNTKIIDYYDKETVRSTIEVTSGDWAYDRTSTSYPMPMAASDPTTDIVPGDQVRLSIQAYSTNGAGTKLLSSEVKSIDYEVKNAGIVRVKVGGTWKEGQVYVKVNGSWKEAETVSTKVNGSWKESQ